MALRSPEASVSGSKLKRDATRSTDDWVQREDGKWYRTDYYKLEEDTVGLLLWEKIWIGTWKLASSEWVAQQRIGRILVLGSNSNVQVAPPIVTKTLAVDDEFNVHKYFLDAAAFIREGLLEGQPVLILCQDAKVFSPTFVIVFLLAVQHMSLNDAYAAIRSRMKAGWSLSEVILQQLRQFEERLRAKDDAARKEKEQWEALLRERDQLKLQIAELERLLHEARLRIQQLEGELSILRTETSSHHTIIEQYEQRLIATKQEYELQIQRLTREYDERLDTLRRQFQEQQERWDLQIKQYREQINITVSKNDREAAALREENQRLAAKIEELLRRPKPAPPAADVDVELVMEKHDEVVQKKIARAYSMPTQASVINPAALSVIHTDYVTPSVWVPPASVSTINPYYTSPAPISSFAYSTTNPAWYSGYSAPLPTWGSSIGTTYSAGLTASYVEAPTTWENEKHTSWSIRANCSDPVMAQKINTYLNQNYSHVNAADPRKLLEDAKRAVQGIAEH
eukprot:TRINITY_DN1878_c0_g1_i1.p2 TRINITY_DN1878_c0_g1~~TRINITY_DN1878_c0_g1_i1.p2  ORF type:complete len:512 (+),score=117.46 TRINITY_DN1878_c0_g1_i1:30-1565(+)